MKYRLLCAVLGGCFLAQAALWSQNIGKPGENFTLTKDSVTRAEGLAPGETLTFSWNNSAIFPGTQRVITVYVPRAYDGQTPACVAVFQDKGGYQFETVFDNLIRTQEMPETIGVTVPPGNVPGVLDPSGVRHNRTFEYDTPSDRYARFLLEEILPAVGKLKTSDGRPVVLSDKGNDRMIAGNSSGGAAAFNAAWARPEEFSRVFTSVGSYTGLRGAYIYPTLVHKTEPKALRLFLQSGTRDMWTSFGDWWSANNAMVRALDYAGYDFNYAFGEGMHSEAHGTVIFPEVMRYLWKGWPAPVQPKQPSRNQALKAVTVPGQGWETLAGTFSGARNLCADGAGEVYFSRGDKVSKRPRADVAERAGEGMLWAFAPDGVSRIVEKGGALQVVSPDGSVTELARALPISALAVTNTGDVYAGAASSPGARTDQIWLLRAGEAPFLVADHIKGVGALCVSPDGNWLAAYESDTTRGYSFRIEKDGALSCGQSFYVLHKEDVDDAASPAAAVADASPNAYQYVATDLGVQLCDANGRSAAIIPLPEGTPAVAVCFGDKDFKTLYALGANGKIYRRPLQVSGSAPFLPPTPVRVKAG